MGRGSVHLHRPREERMKRLRIAAVVAMAAGVLGWSAPVRAEPAASLLYHLSTTTVSVTEVYDLPTKTSTFYFSGGPGSREALRSDGTQIAIVYATSIIVISVAN